MAGRVRGHRAIAQHEVRQDGKDRAARRTLETPERHPRHTDTAIMRVARQTPAAAPGGRVLQRKAEREEERQAPFAQGLTRVKPRKIGRFIREIDGDRAVVPRLGGYWAPGVPPRSSGVVSGGDTMGVTR